MENQYCDKLCEDIVKISNIIPNLSVETIRSELNKVAAKEDGVLIVVRKYLLTYDVTRQNAMSDDIKKIKRIVPNYSIVNITKDLSEVAEEPYRVQLVLKKYFENENLPIKRSFDDLQETSGTASEKKLKTDGCSVLNIENQTIFYDDIDDLIPLTQSNVPMEHVVDLTEVKHKQEQPATSTTNVDYSDSQTEQSTQSTQEYLLDDIMQLLLAHKDYTGGFTEPYANENQNPGKSMYQAPTLLHDLQVQESRNGALPELADLIIPITTEEEHQKPGPSKCATINPTYNLFPVAVASTSTAHFTNGTTDDEDVVITSVQRGDSPKTPPVIDLTMPKQKTVTMESAACKEETLDQKQGAEHVFFFKLMEMFPDIDPNYLRTLCAAEPNDSGLFDKLVNRLLAGHYNRRVREKSPEIQLDFDEQLKLLLDLFPDADPSYLQNHCERLIDHADLFSQFVATLLETKNYPSKADYLKKVKLSAQEKQYTTEFDVTKFLEVIPNPEQYFNDSNRTVAYSQPGNMNYALTFLKNHYSHLHVREITHVFNTHGSVIKSAQVLNTFKQSMRAKRKLYPLTSCQNIPLLQEIAYVTHNKEIRKYLMHQEEMKMRIRQAAKEAGSMNTCGCCFDDEIMPEDTAYCEAGHLFCKECVRKGCEVVIGQGKLQFPCLDTCDSNFSLQVLQSVLSPKVFSKMVKKKQLEEIKAAGIEELEFCPFCDFATIPAPGDKLFRCLDDECMKESCRQCREPSHIPLRCDEVEKEEEVKTRTYIEDKMTEALVRQCYKCNMKFVKEDGCNKMTCSCGAMMCYVCNKPVQDYTHFNGQGGTQYHLCPLFSDTEKLHMEAVKRSAQAAKQELGIGTEKQLKHDPTENLDEHYKKLLKPNNHFNHQ